MALTRRAAFIALAGVLLVFVYPLRGYMVLIVEGALVVGIVADLALAGSVRALRVSRFGDTARRLDEVSEVGVLVVNTGGRRVRGVLRDAWPPSAQASPSRRLIDVPAGERRRFETAIRPRRRTELQAGRVTVRSFGPLGLAARQGNHDVPWSLRVLPGIPESALPAGKACQAKDSRWPHRCAGARAGHRVRLVARLRRGRRRQVN